MTPSRMDYLDIHHPQGVGFLSKASSSLRYFQGLLVGKVTRVVLLLVKAIAFPRRRTTLVTLPPRRPCRTSPPPRFFRVAVTKYPPGGRILSNLALRAVDTYRTYMARYRPGKYGMNILLQN